VHNYRFEGYFIENSKILKYKYLYVLLQKDPKQYPKLETQKSMVRKLTLNTNNKT
jgi:hypothetical protein